MIITAVAPARSAKRAWCTVRSVVRLETPTSVGTRPATCLMAVSATASRSSSDR
jgi:hypothetical protein